MTSNLISCQLHDYIEVACLYGYIVRLTLDDHQVLEGKAVDTLTSAEKREYLLIDTGQIQSIELNRLHSLKVIAPSNAQFTEIVF